MNAPIDRPQLQTLAALPPQFEALCPSPQLLPGENIDHYHALQDAIFRDIKQASFSELQGTAEFYIVSALAVGSGRRA